MLPVSYTHLDVYKRQEYPDPARLMALEEVEVGCALESKAANNAGATRRTVFMSKGPSSIDVRTAKLV